MNKKISIIISVWNGEQYLAEAIESALQQDYPHKEIIVVNDGSTDKTSGVIQQFGQQIISVTQENKGLGAGRNKGVKMATGDFLAFLDHDDLWEKNKLTLQMELWQAHQTQDPLVFSLTKQFICPSLNEIEKQVLLVNDNILSGYIASALFLSKSRFFQVGYFFEKNQVGEFIDWYQRAVEKQVPVVMLNEVMLYRRIHRSNMGRQSERYKRTDYLKILKSSLDRRRNAC